MRTVRYVSLMIVVIIVLAACATSVSNPDEPAAIESAREAAPATVPATPTLTTVPDVAPTAVSPSPTDTVPLGEKPPARAELEFSTDFSLTSVSYAEILSGGPPKDGIPALDAPQFVEVSSADEWLADSEAVVAVEIGEKARAYPVQIFMWHEIVNDEIDGIPVSTTYCPLCNTAVAFDRRLDDQVLDFGTTGRLRFSNMVMYDRQTESWWQQATGEAIVGELVGSQLKTIPSPLISWSDFKRTYPDGLVLSKETGFNRVYGQNPYAGYDDEAGTPFAYRGPDTPEILAPLARVVTIDTESETVAYPYEVLREVSVINDVVGGDPVAVLWTPGTASPLDAGSVAGGEDVGAATTFSRQLDEKVLDFVFRDGAIIDEETGSEWDILGRATTGPLIGRQLRAVTGINHFWFSWAAFRPETRVYTSELTAESDLPVMEDAATSASVAPVEVTELPADFEIALYVGEDSASAEQTTLSQLVGVGKPVVLVMWAGLCPACRVEMPRVEAAYQEYSDQVTFVGLDVGPFVRLGSHEDGLKLVRDTGVTFPNGTTDDSSVPRSYKLLGTPSIYFIQSNGEVQKQYSGALSEQQLDESILALIDASNGS